MPLTTGIGPDRVKSGPWRRFRHALLLALVLAVSACGPLGESAVTGQVKFARDVRLPDGAVVVVSLSDTSLADAPAKELGRAVIDNPGQLPVRFRVAYDPAAINPRNEYSLQARITDGDSLLYVNDTVHPVLTGGAPNNSDVEVVSVDPYDRCVSPLPVRIHAGNGHQADVAGAEIRVRLVDVSDPDDRIIVTEARQAGYSGSFPIEIFLPEEGVAISRHRRYEMEAEIWISGELGYHIPREEWRTVRPAHCPDPDNPLVNDVFPVGLIDDEPA